MQRQALSGCSEEKFVPDRRETYSRVTAFKNIKRACAAPITSYDDCLAKNRSSPLECIKVLREVRPYPFEVNADGFVC